jgi:3-dehydroquinate synthase
VEKDLTEQNERKWLNFGHTIGHGVELDESNNLLHGECVSIGMVKAL